MRAALISSAQQLLRGLLWRAGMWAAGAVSQVRAFPLGPGRVRLVVKGCRNGEHAPVRQGWSGELWRRRRKPERCAVINRGRRAGCGSGGPPCGTARRGGDVWLRGKIRCGGRCPPPAITRKVGPPPPPPPTTSCLAADTRGDAAAAVCALPARHGRAVLLRGPADCPVVPLGWQTDLVVFVGSVSGPEIPLLILTACVV